MATSFQKDIAPMLAPFRANMIWRFDITNYDTVKEIGRASCRERV